LCRYKWAFKPQAVKIRQGVRAGREFEKKVQPGQDNKKSQQV